MAKLNMKHSSRPEGADKKHSVMNEIIEEVENNNENGHSDSWVRISTGCPKKNALLSFKAYNSGLEAAIGTSRDSFGILRLSAFFWDQEVQDYLKASLRKTCLKLATLSQNLTILYQEI